MSENPRVAILMGSDSDLPVMAEAGKVFKKLEIGHKFYVTSAHRSPKRTAEIIEDSVSRGVQVIIAGAGAAAHLAGVVAAHTTVPVLGVPLAASDLNGLDALLATVQMPAGIPVGTLAIGRAGATNAAWLAASILALADDGLAKQLRDHRQEMAEGVARKHAAAQGKLAALIGD